MSDTPSSSALVPYDESATEITIRKLQDTAREYQRYSISAATQRLYSDVWVHFYEWCRAHNLSHLPATPQTICLYLTARAEHHVYRSVRRDASALAMLHRLAKLPAPTESEDVRLLLRGMGRIKGNVATPKRALVLEDVLKILPLLPDSLHGLRDRTILLLGLYGALRRSEIVALQAEDLTFVEGGVVLLLRFTKTDIRRLGVRVAIRSHVNPEVCAVDALTRWLKATGIEAGSVFRSVDRYGRVDANPISTSAVAQIVKQWAAAIGLDPKVFSGHSLRRGFATTASRQGVPLQRIAVHMRHVSTDSTFGYIEVSEAIRDGVLLDV